MKMRNAIVTASYAPDYERCAILCETIDRHVTGHSCHYLLVDTIDAALFKRLEGPGRRVITEADLLPTWLRRLPAALSPGGRRVWVSPFTLPLHGWHVQQLKRIAVAGLLDDDGLLFCDSDVAFVRDFDVGAIWQDGAMRLYRAENAAGETGVADHLRWIAHAGRTLGVPEAHRPSHDYVSQFVTWRRQTVLDMCAHIETVHNRHWASVIGRSRKFSECMIYGAYVDAVLAGAGHIASNRAMGAVRWFDPAPTDAELAAMIDGLAPHQVGIGVQSFVAMDAGRFRAAVLGEPAHAA